MKQFFGSGSQGGSGNRGGSNNRGGPNNRGGSNNRRGSNNRGGSSNRGGSNNANNRSQSPSNAQNNSPNPNDNKEQSNDDKDKKNPRPTEPPYPRPLKKGPRMAWGGRNEPTDAREKAWEAYDEALAEWLETPEGRQEKIKRENEEREAEWQKTRKEEIERIRAERAAATEAAAQAAALDGSGGGEAMDLSGGGSGTGNAGNDASSILAEGAHRALVEREGVQKKPNTRAAGGGGAGRGRGSSNASQNSGGERGSNVQSATTGIPMDSAFSSTLSNLFGTNTGGAAKGDGKTSTANAPLGNVQDSNYALFPNADSTGDGAALPTNPTTTNAGAATNQGNSSGNGSQNAGNAPASAQPATTPAPPSSNFTFVQQPPPQPTAAGAAPNTGGGSSNANQTTGTTPANTQPLPPPTHAPTIATVGQQAPTPLGSFSNHIVNIQADPEGDIDPETSDQETGPKFKADPANRPKATLRKKTLRTSTSQNLESAPTPPPWIPSQSLPTLVSDPSLAPENHPNRGRIDIRPAHVPVGGGFIGTAPPGDDQDGNTAAPSGTPSGGIGPVAAVPGSQNNPAGAAPASTGSDSLGAGNVGTVPDSSTSAPSSTLPGPVTPVAAASDPQSNSVISDAMRGYRGFFESKKFGLGKTTDTATTTAPAPPAAAPATLPALHSSALGAAQTAFAGSGLSAVNHGIGQPSNTGITTQGNAAAVAPVAAPAPQPHGTGSAQNTTGSSSIANNASGNAPAEYDGEDWGSELLAYVNNPDADNSSGLSEDHDGIANQPAPAGTYDPALRSSFNFTFQSQATVQHGSPSQPHGPVVTGFAPEQDMSQDDDMAQASSQDAPPLTVDGNDPRAYNSDSQFSPIQEDNNDDDHNTQDDLDKIAEDPSRYGVDTEMGEAESSATEVDTRAQTTITFQPDQPTFNQPEYNQQTTDAAFGPAVDQQANGHVPDQTLDAPSTTDEQMLDQPQDDHPAAETSLSWPRASVSPTSDSQRSDTQSSPDRHKWERSARDNTGSLNQMMAGWDLKNEPAEEAEVDHEDPYRLTPPTTPTRAQRLAQRINLPSERTLPQVEPPTTTSIAPEQAEEQALDQRSVTTTTPPSQHLDAPANGHDRFSDQVQVAQQASNDGVGSSDSPQSQANNTAGATGSASQDKPPTEGGSNTTPAPTSATAPEQPGHDGGDDEVECSNCTSRVPRAGAALLPCSHHWCLECLNELFKSWAQGDDESRPICCEKPIQLSTANYLLTTEVRDMVRARWAMMNSTGSSVSQGSQQKPTDHTSSDQQQQDSSESMNSQSGTTDPTPPAQQQPSSHNGLVYIKCFNCGEDDLLDSCVKLSCSHYWCLYCLEKPYQSFADSPNNSTPPACKCSTPIEYDLVEPHLRPEVVQSVRDKLAQQHNQVAGQNTGNSQVPNTDPNSEADEVICRCCKLPRPRLNCLKLKCGHFWCVGCLNGEFMRYANDPGFARPTCCRSDRKIEWTLVKDILDETVRESVENKMKTSVNPWTQSGSNSGNTQSGSSGMAGSSSGTSDRINQAGANHQQGDHSGQGPSLGNGGGPTADQPRQQVELTGFEEVKNSLRRSIEQAKENRVKQSLQTAVILMQKWHDPAKQERFDDAGECAREAFASARSLEVCLALQARCEYYLAFHEAADKKRNGEPLRGYDLDLYQEDQMARRFRNAQQAEPPYIEGRWAAEWVLVLAHRSSTHAYPSIRGEEPYSIRPGTSMVELTRKALAKPKDPSLRSERGSELRAQPSNAANRDTHVGRGLPLDLQGSHFTNQMRFHGANQSVLRCQDPFQALTEECCQVQLIRCQRIRQMQPKYKTLRRDTAF